MERTISIMVGKDSINHNNRKFTAKNVDADRTKDNINFVQENVKRVYHELFDEAVDEYNKKQKRSDRKISDYYKRIQQDKQKKNYHEIVVQTGNQEDTGCGTYAAEEAVKLLTDYMNGFCERNPNLRVFNACIHLDEATPHLHIDFIPFTTNATRGPKVQVSMKQAMKELGFVGNGRGNTEWRKWVEHEKKVLAELMRNRGIDWLEKRTHEEHLDVLDFKKKKRVEEVRELDNIIRGKKCISQNYDEDLAIQRRELAEGEKNLLTVTDDISFNKGILSNMEDEIEEKRNAILKQEKEIENSRILIGMQESEYQNQQKTILDNSVKKKELEKEIESLDETKQIYEVGILEQKYNIEEGEAKLKALEEKTEIAKKVYEEYACYGASDREKALRSELIDKTMEVEKLKEENSSLREKLKKAYDFMKQFTLEGRNMLEHFMDTLTEKTYELVDRIRGGR